MESIGTIIRELRQENGDTLKELGTKVGYSYGGIAKIEHGTNKASLKLLEKISAVYNVPMSHFLNAEVLGSEWLSFVNDMEERNIKPSDLREIIDFLDNWKGKK